MTIDLFILMLVGFMLVAGLIAVESRDLLSAVIAVGAGGFALCVIDLLLGAPDLAFPQVVVEIITLVLLIRMIVTRTDTSRQTPGDTLRTGVVLLAGGIILVAVFLAAGGLGGAGTMPAFGHPVVANSPAGPGTPPGVSAEYLARCTQDTGAANTVAGILLDYRAYDTLGEATVIFVAILGGYVVLRSIGRKREGEADAS